MKQFFSLLKAILLIFLVSASSFAEVEGEGEPTLVIPATENHWVQPKWSPNGNFIAFSSEGFKGIWVAKPDGSELRQVSEEEGVGFGFSWAPNSESILVRATEYRGKSRFQSIKLINVLSGKTETIVEPTRGIKSLPILLENGSTVITVVNDLPVIKEMSKVEGVEAEHSFLFPTGSKFFRHKDGLKDAEPVVDFGTRNIYNVRFSPSGKKVAFQVATKGLFVMDEDGGNLTSLGFFERPSWMPQEDKLVVMRTHDDGYTFTSGQLYSIDLITGEEKFITGGSHIIALTPDVSPCGNFVAFEGFLTGGIFVFQIK